MPDPSTYDLVVVGGGPAGSTAARRAALGGLSTLLLDAAEFPRNKPCGGGLTEQAMSYLDFPVPRDLHEAEIYGARVHYRGKTATARLDTRLAVIVSRRRFDTLLLERAADAGAHVGQGTRVTAVEDHGSYVELTAAERTVRARYCVIAAGGSSRLGHVIRGPLGKHEYAVAVEMDVPCPAQQVREFADGLIDVHFGVAHMGYAWIFPHAEWFNVGLAGIASRMEQPRARLERFAEQLPPAISSRSAGATNRVGAPIPAGGLRRPVAAGRVLMAGDAAGFVDSFYGEGIAYAVRSGALAAEAILADHDAADAYARACLREIVRPLQYSYVLSKLLHRYPALLLRVFASHPVVLQRFLLVPARRLSYTAFLRWFLPRVPYFMLTRSVRSPVAPHAAVSP